MFRKLLGLSFVLEDMTAQGIVDLGSPPGPNKEIKLKGSMLVSVRLLVKACRSGKTKAGPGYRVYLILLSVRPK